MPERRPATLDAEAAHAAHAAGPGHVAPPPVEAVDAEAVRPLRGAVLRPGRPVSELFFEADDDPRTGHYAVRDAGTIVGVATVMPGGHPGDPRPGDWRIRGMAVEQDHRGGGIGSALLTACEAHARRGGGSRLWCNARIAAINLYLRSGMVIEGEQFDIPGIGMHLLMSRALD
jgi:GNAT superfamily N-acetyltransferase